MTTAIEVSGCMYGIYFEISQLTKMKYKSMKVRFFKTCLPQYDLSLVKKKLLCIDALVNSKLIGKI